MLFPVSGIYETHLSVQDRQRSVKFYSETLGLPLAKEIVERDVTFFWVDESMKGLLGIWGSKSQNPCVSGRGHFAFSVELNVLRTAADTLKSKGIEPLSIDGTPVAEPIVICWMPAVSIYFNDPDGNSLEIIHMLNDLAQPELGIVSLSEWERK